MLTNPLLTFILVFMVFTSGCIAEHFTEESADEFIGCGDGAIPDENEEFSECTIDDNIANSTMSGENNTDNVSASGENGNSTTPSDTDGDGDGVGDSDDACPATPAGETVDAQGCTVISDTGGDGNSSNGTNNNQSIQQSGANEGDLIYNFNALIHHNQDAGWSELEFHSLFNSSWENSNNNSTNGSDKWIVVVFLSTDCGHCWNAADDLSEWSTNYSNDVQFLAMAVNFSSNNNFNATPEEVIAFQEQSTYIGCVGGGYDCADRPGSPHNFGYVDDRNQTQMHAWGVSGTPTFFIIQPDGIVAWNQSQNAGEESIEQALERLFG